MENDSPYCDKKSRLPIFQRITKNFSPYYKNSPNKENSFLTDELDSEDTNSCSPERSSKILMLSKQNEYNTVYINLCGINPINLIKVFSKIGTISSIEKVENFNEIYSFAFEKIHFAIKAKSLLAKFCNICNIREFENYKNFTSIILQEQKNYTDFSINYANIEHGYDKRTTIMIRNIPNKYTQQMLLEAINANFYGLFDFFYLPIDFKNRCNMGYAFVNFKDPKTVAKFSQEFSGKMWGKFHSKKICSITYARIQGLEALVKNFEKSSIILSEDPEIKPIILCNNY